MQVISFTHDTRLGSGADPLVISIDLLKLPNLLLTRIRNQQNIPHFSLSLKIAISPLGE